MLQSLSDTGTANSCDSACQTSQRQALTQLFRAWDGPNWLRRSNWLAENESVCSWEGVHCCLGTEFAAGSGVVALPGADDEPCPAGATGVVALSLARNNMTGDLSAVPWAAFNSTLQ